MKLQSKFLCIISLFAVVISDSVSKNKLTANPELSNWKPHFPSMKKVYVTDKPLTSAKPDVSTENVKFVLPTMKKIYVTEKPATTVKDNIPRRTLMPKIRPKPVETRTEFVYKEPITRRPLMKSPKLITDRKVPHPKKEYSIVYRYEEPTTLPETPLTPLPTPSINLDLNNNNFKNIPSTPRSSHKRKSLSLTEKLNLLKASKQNKLKEDLTTQKNKKRVEVEATTIKTIDNEDFTTEMTGLETLIDEKSFISDPEVKTTTSVSMDIKNEELIFVQSINSKPKEGNSVTTTEASSINSSRRKRNVNIIEEENLGSTISGFKFTGREPRLTNDLSYRNINW